MARAGRQTTSPEKRRMSVSQVKWNVGLVASISKPIPVVGGLDAHRETSAIGLEHLCEKGETVLQVPMKSNLTGSVHHAYIHCSCVKVDPAAIFTGDFCVVHKALL